MGFWFCPECGCEDCEFFSDTFDTSGSSTDWTVGAGTWNFDDGDSNVLDTSSASARIISDTAEPDGDSQQVVTVKIRADTNGDQARVLIAYDDANNHLYAEFEFGVCGTLELHQVSTAGGDVLLDSFVLNELTISTWHEVVVCYKEGTYPDSGRLSVKFGGQYYHTDVDATGDQAGLGAGTLTGTMEYDDWKQETHDDGDGCPDCDQPVICDIFDDSFVRGDSTDIGCAWEEAQGNWEIDSNELEVAVGGALAIVEWPHPRRTSASKVSTEIKGDTTGDTARIILDYVDDANFHYAEAKFNTTGSTLQLYKMTAGVPSAIGSSASAVLALNTFYTMEACFDPENNYFNASVGGAEVSYKFAAEHGGDRVGLGTGTGAGVINFNGINWDRHQSADDPLCPTCVLAEPCNNCVDNEMPSAWKVVVPACWTTTSSCVPFPTDECNAVLSGTFIVDTGVTPCIRTSGGQTPCDPFDAWGPQVEVRTSGGSFFVEFTFRADSGALVTWRKTFTAKPDCKNFRNESIPFIGTTDASQCDPTGCGPVLLTAI